MLMVSSEQSGGVEPRRAVAVVGTLLPHLHPARHHVYRVAIAVALLAALLGAGFGSLSVALVLAAVALPAVVLVYIHDHHLWRDEPVTVIALAFGLSLVLGVGVGFVHTLFTPGISVATGGHGLPPVERVLELGVVVPVVAFVAVLVAPLLVSTREAFRHPWDVVVTSALSGAALSLGLSVVVQHGAFTHVQATSGEPARVAFIALTLGFLQPVVLATASAVAVLGLRSAGVSPVVGVVEGLVLVVAYGLAVTLLAPFGSRGIVLTALAALIVAGAGLAAARSALHAAAVEAPDVEHAEHRLHGAVVAAVVAVVVFVAAAITGLVVLRGPGTPPTPPHPSGIVPKTHKAAVFGPALRGGVVVGNLVLASASRSLADGTAVNFPDGVSVTVAPGWSISQSWSTGVWANDSANSASIELTSGHGHAPDISTDLAWMINNDINVNVLTNVDQSPDPDGVQSVQGSNFTQESLVGYTADMQTNQGTVQLTGVWVELFNPATQNNAFIDLRAANNGDLQQAIPDAKNMISSMI
jgi:hypothetical protein